MLILGVEGKLFTALGKVPSSKPYGGRWVHAGKESPAATGSKTIKAPKIKGARISLTP